MTAALPQLHDHLPDLCAFIATQARDIAARELRDGDELARRIRDFYTPERKAKFRQSTLQVFATLRRHVEA
jgi:hypothetical protein